MFTFMSRAIALTALTLLSSCGIPEGLGNLEQRSFVFRPSATGVTNISHDYLSGVCPEVFLDRRGRGSVLLAQWQRAGGAADGGMLVGYSSEISRGQDPFPCNLWKHNAFQGRTFFDLSGLPEGAIVRSARLGYAMRPLTYTDHGPASTPCTYNSGTAAGLRTADFVHVRGPSEMIAARPTMPQNAMAGTGHDVTRSVSRWVREGTSDNWFVFSSEAGRAFVEHDEDDGVTYCAMQLNDITLQITAMVPPED